MQGAAKRGITSICLPSLHLAEMLHVHYRYIREWTMQHPHKTQYRPPLPGPPCTATPRLDSSPIPSDFPSLPFPSRAIIIRRHSFVIATLLYI